MSELKSLPAYSKSKDSSDPERSGGAGEIAPYTGRVDDKEYGHVRRGLKSRHVQFIAIGGIIGTGLFVGSGAALVRAGPLSILLAYSIVGTVIYSLILAIGEVCHEACIECGNLLIRTDDNLASNSRWFDRLRSSVRPPPNPR